MVNIKTAACGWIFLIAASAAFGQYEDAHQRGTVQLSAGFSAGSMFAGNQYHDFHDAIRPQPDRVGADTVQLDLKVFPMTYLGLEASSDVIDIVSASYQTNTPFYEALMTVYSGGILLRLPLSVDDFSGDLFVGGGANYNSFSYMSDYVNLVHNSGYALQAVDPQVGYYVKAGGTLFLAKPYFGVVEIEYQKIAETLSQTQVQFDGEYLKFNLRVGLDF
jgi:hypothetical protein